MTLNHNINCLHTAMYKQLATIWHQEEQLFQLFFKSFHGALCVITANHR